MPVFSRSFVQGENEVEQGQASQHRPLGVVLMAFRIAEVGKHTVPHVARDKAVVPGNRLSAGVLVVSHQGA